MIKTVLFLTSLLILGLLLAGCPTGQPDQQARDINAALQGAIVQAQSQYLTECKADPAKLPCTTINRAVDGQNALTSAIEIYCGWPVGVNIPSDTQCKANKSALASLQAAAASANQLTLEVKGLVKP